MPDGDFPSWYDESYSRRKEAARRRASAKVSEHPLAQVQRDLARARLDRQRHASYLDFIGDSEVETGFPGLRARPSDVSLMAGSMALPGVLRAAQAPRALGGVLGAVRLLMRDHPNLWKEPSQYYPDDLLDDAAKKTGHARGGRIRLKDGGQGDGPGPDSASDTSSGSNSDYSDDSSRTGPAPGPEAFGSMIGADDRNFDLMDVQNQINTALGLDAQARNAGLYGGVSLPGFHDPGLAASLSQALNNPAFGFTPDVANIGPEVRSMVQSMMEATPIGSMMSKTSPVNALATMAGMATGLPVGWAVDEMTDPYTDLGPGHTGMPSPENAGKQDPTVAFSGASPKGALASMVQPIAQQGPSVAPVVFDALNFNPYTGDYYEWGTNPPGHHFFV